MSETSQTTTAPAEIVELVQRFRDQQSAYRAGKYNETQLRRDFLDPLFEALGWDVSNRKNYSEKYREVVHELSVEIEGQAKAADYAFQTGGAIHFLLEAKKPAVNIETNPEPAFQIRRYGWSAKVPVGVLSDFEQLAVYDCRTRPVHGDPAHKDRARLFHFSEYVEKWAELYQLLSHQAVHQGSLDQFIQAQKGKRGTADVDDAFLLEMERWREELARNIALRNPGLSQYELNSAVQTTIDRLIFLRICEDRGIEPENALREATDGKEVYSDLLELFRRADRKYNSGLFHFEEEKGQPSYPDRLTPTIKIDDRVLKDILANLYYPRSPYAFKYIPADILGQVYERFLGKVIRLTAGHQARVEEKPEVRKAGGVYYTPTYIVDYIVKNTLGELLKTRDPESLAENPLRVLDPACGSGSFLLGAYQYLLDWHLDWYSANDPARWARGKTPPVYESRGGWALSMEKKKEILTRHIFGVDIDPQAVEVTKLSLLLKVVENPGQLSLLGERILPDLGRNIQCGNSLIGPDYYEGRQLAMFDSEEQRRVNAFDWRSAFPQVFAAGGFDAVIGNPPYRLLQPNNTEDELLSYFRRNYPATEYKIEFFHLFIQLAVNLSKVGGMISYIVPSTILNNVYAENLRGYLQKSTLIRLLAISSEKVFSNADVYTLVFVLQKNSIDTQVDKHRINVITNLNQSTSSGQVVYKHVDQILFSNLPGNTWNVLLDEKHAALINKLIKNNDQLGNRVTINRGLITGDRGKYFSKSKLSPSYIPIIAGSDVSRYAMQPVSEYVLFEKPQGSGGSWDPDVHLAEHKVVVRQIGVKPMGTYINEPLAITGNLFSIRGSSPEEELFILGVYNSKLCYYYWNIMLADFKVSFPQVTIFSLSQIPIKRVVSRREQELQSDLINVVRTIVDMHKKLQSVRLPEDRERLQRQIEAADRQIDRLVYELYGLSEDEIRVVEGG